MLVFLTKFWGFTLNKRFMMFQLGLQKNGTCLGTIHMHYRTENNFAGDRPYHVLGEQY